MKSTINQLVKSYIYWPEIQNPYQKSIDFSKVKIKYLATIEEEFLKEKRTFVEYDILRFYALNHYLGEYRKIHNQVMDKNAIKVYQNYLQEITTQSQKLLSYLFTSCLTESLYDQKIENGGGATGKGADEDGDYKKKPWQVSKTYLKDIPENKVKDFSIFLRFLVDNHPYFNLNNRTALSKKALASIKKDPTIANLSLGDVLFFIKTIFLRGDFDEGYGGGKWAAIADHAYKFATGAINAEVFIDQAYSLEHNGGSVFNKEHIYNYDEIVLNVLDAQESMETSQFILNMQHVGEILNFLSLNINPNSLNNNVKLSVSEKLTLKSLLKFQQEFKKNNPDFILNDLNYGNHFQFLNFFDQLSKQVNEDGYQNFKLNSHCKKFLTTLEQKINQTNKEYAQNKVNVKAKQTITKKTNAIEFYSLSDLDKKKQDRLYLGGKGLGLVNMHQLNLPVPPALIFPTTNCQAYLHNPIAWKKQLNKQINDVLPMLKQDEQPQLVSVRSGSPISMPGMMDTILNVGFGSDNWDYFCKNLGGKVAEECYSKFIHLFCKSYLGEEIKPSKYLKNEVEQFKKILKKNHIPFNKEGLFPLTPTEQIKYSIEAVFSSWQSKRATAYRDHNKISEQLGTACIIQKMAFGNLNNNSCTGVLFSRDCINGSSGAIGEFLIKAQGEDVVSGSKTPLNIEKMKQWNPKVYKKLMNIANFLETETGEIQDIEFTVENGELYILQHRKAVCSEQALVKFKIDQLKNKMINIEELIKNIPPTYFNDNTYIKSKTSSKYQGLSANPGVIQGIIVKNEQDIKKYTGKGSLIFYAPETKPDHAPLMLKTDAFLTERGGFTSHAAILARSWNKPCIVNIGKSTLVSGQKISLDAGTGSVYLGYLEIAKDHKKNQKIKDIVAGYYKLNNLNISQTELNQLINKLNSKKTWMEDYAETKVIHFDKSKNKKFIELVNKLSLFIVQKQQNHSIPQKLSLGVKGTT